MIAPPRKPLAARLVHFLDDAAEWRFALGEHDCLLLIADWWAHLTGHDPAAPWRGTYHTAIGASRIIRARGGLERLLSASLSACDGVSATDPRVGDVGLIERAADHDTHQVGAIRTTTGWATFDQTGLAIAPAVCLSAWRAREWS